MVDLFTTYFRFNINHKTLETLIVQGGMGAGVSLELLARAAADTGSIGTIATTGLKYFGKLPDNNESNIILGINNLVLASDYEENYQKAVLAGMDFVASGAGLSKEVIRRTKDQEDYFGKKHCWTIPLISNVEQLRKRIERRPGYIILENIDSGGHNGEGKGFEGTLEEYRSSAIDKGKTKVIFAGGIRTPDDFVKVIDHGFDAAQLGTAFLRSIEANYKFKDNVIHAGEEGWPSARRIPSVTGLPANGFPIEIMEGVLNGVKYERLICSGDESFESNKTPEGKKNNKSKGCISDCTRIAHSAKQAGINPDSVGNFCIMQALRATLQIGTKIDYPALVFSGLYPEKLPKWCADGKPIPAREIIGRYLIGAYDSIIGGAYKTPGFNGKITDEHRFFLEEQFKIYSSNELVPLKAKILNERSFAV